jgi:hypothetical protein
VFWLLAIDGIVSSGYDLNTFNPCHKGLITKVDFNAMEAKVRDWVGLFKHQNNYELEMVLQASHLFRPTISPRLVTINIPNEISTFYLGLHSKPI